MRQKARLAAWLLALDLAALYQGHADRQERLSQHISASSHNPEPCRAGRPSCVQLTGPGSQSSHRSQWETRACVTAFTWLKEPVRWEKGHRWHRTNALCTRVIIFLIRETTYINKLCLRWSVSSARYMINNKICHWKQFKCTDSSYFYAFEFLNKMLKLLS